MPVHTRTGQKESPDEVSPATASSPDEANMEEDVQPAVNNPVLAAIASQRTEVVFEPRALCKRPGDEEPPRPLILQLHHYGTMFSKTSSTGGYNEAAVLSRPEVTHLP
ncbi:hypothetical protein SKAU_G00020550 [Synaphobranchus kaupii]|uniref:Uncharacterized protein n=1 Tax=Synaphobranchus kaupii TaxID=118154 RepID=A0A9Q1GC71_SYNKA|nr:hypothetical protein SKAU_G00020550 [Synaphobranchus kaupii]